MDADSGSDMATDRTAPAAGASIETGPTSAEAPAPTAPTTTDEPEWSPAPIEEGTGIALDGNDLPINHRLRAERLALDGKDEDPGGIISPELIADASDRLDRVRDAVPAVYVNMKVSDLEKIAKDEDVDLTDAANNEERVRRIEAARPELPGMDSLKAHEETR